jgi:hypothetical protein
MLKWPSAVATLLYAYIVFLFIASACQHAVLRCWLGNPRFKEYVWFPWSILALGHVCSTNSLVLSLQNDWLRVEQASTQTDAGWTIMDASSSRYGEVSDSCSNSVDVVIKLQCIRMTSFGISTRNKWSVLFPRVLSP